MTAGDERKRALAAERQRRRRALTRSDTLQVKIRVERAAREMLIEAGRLAEWEEDSAKATAEAVEELLGDLAIGRVTA